MPGGIPDSPGSSGGASGSVDFGDATALREQMRKATAGTQGPTGEPAAQGGGGAAQAPPPPPPAGAGQPDAQPPAADEGQQGFNIANYPLQQRQPPATPWREQLAIWASHPQANDALRRLARLASKQ